MQQKVVILVVGCLKPTPLNPSMPKISLVIPLLFTVCHTILMMRALRIWHWVNKKILKLLFFFILITCLIDVVLILKGEILSWSLMGVIGLKGKKVLSKFFHISLFFSSLQLANAKKGPNVSMHRFCGLWS